MVDARDHRHRLRRDGDARAEGHEEADRVLLGLATSASCMLGIFALNMAGMQGGVLQMVNHGLSTGGLFLLVGIIYERRHTRMIAEYGGLAQADAALRDYFLIIALSSMGLPLLNGFIGEFTILQGAFAQNFWWAFFAATGIVLGAAYLLWLYQRVFFGELTNPANAEAAGPDAARAADARAARDPGVLDRPLSEADLRRASGVPSEKIVHGRRRARRSTAPALALRTTPPRRPRPLRGRASVTFPSARGLVPPLAGALPHGGGPARCSRLAAAFGKEQEEFLGFLSILFVGVTGALLVVRRGGAGRATRPDPRAACSSRTTSRSSSRFSILLSLVADDPRLGALRGARRRIREGSTTRCCSSPASGCCSWSSGDNLISIYVALETDGARLLRPRRLLQGRGEVDRGGAQVLHARRLLLGRPALRPVARLRRRRAAGPAGAREAPRRDAERIEPAHARDPAAPRGPALQDRRRAVPRLDARRLRGRADAGDRVLLGRAEGRGLRDPRARSSTSPSRSSTPTGGSSSRSSPRPR